MAMKAGHAREISLRTLLQRVNYYNQLGTRGPADGHVQMRALAAFGESA